MPTHQDLKMQARLIIEDLVSYLQSTAEDFQKLNQIVDLLAESAEEEADRLVISDPNILGGTPIIRGTRIPVHKIASMLNQGASETEIFDNYPTLRGKKIKLAQVYAKKHPEPAHGPHPWHLVGK